MNTVSVLIASAGAAAAAIIGAGVWLGNDKAQQVSMDAPVSQEEVLEYKERKREMARSTEEWQEKVKGKLSADEMNVCFGAGTEPPFTGKYWDHHEDGAYHCTVCNQELFASNTKYDSGSGWPSFYDVVEQSALGLVEDLSLGMRRVEVVCGNCNSHLGHVFEDGPEPTGLRYCINSASLQFKASPATGIEDKVQDAAGESGEESSS